MKATNHPSINNLKGFTLVELLIVMTIVGTLLSLVGPLAIDSLSKAQARAELLSLKTWLRFQSHKAFITGQEIQLSFKGKAVFQIKPTQNTQIKIKQFEYVFFQPQLITFSSNGISSTFKLSATFKGNDLSMPIFDWTDENVFE
ncbi:type II secretion system protein [uncultured Paraglaciecola sp.]|uniref:pilus assembly FimT family protein n=1 Tax=uncultured Paraglaciecola sp. TaxID=1765024 RepID=UPI0025EC603F|nr:type II secretion system protein [uncultured Paraglaciecola sp.]